MCGNGRCILENLRCDYNNDCFDNSDEMHCTAFPARCDFSATVCPDWTMEPDGISRWIRRSAHSSTTLNVPTVDHTTLTGDGKSHTNNLERASFRRVTANGVYMLIFIQNLNTNFYFFFAFRINYTSFTTKYKFSLLYAK